MAYVETIKPLSLANLAKNWSSTWGGIIQGPRSALIFGDASNTDTVLTMSSNAYHDGAWKYMATGLAAQWGLGVGTGAGRVAASGSADGAITWKETITYDGSTTSGETRLLLYDVDKGALSRVSVGAADSGGSGFKLLRVPN